MIRVATCGSPRRRRATPAVTNNAASPSKANAGRNSRRPLPLSGGFETAWTNGVSRILTAMGRSRLSARFAGARAPSSTSPAGGGRPAAARTSSGRRAAFCDGATPSTERAGRRPLSTTAAPEAAEAERGVAVRLSGRAARGRMSAGASAGTRAPGPSGRLPSPSIGAEFNPATTSLGRSAGSGSAVGGSSSTVAAAIGSASVVADSTTGSAADGSAVANGSAAIGSPTADAGAEVPDVGSGSGTSAVTIAGEGTTEAGCGAGAGSGDGGGCAGTGAPARAGRNPSGST